MPIELLQVRGPGRRGRNMDAFLAVPDAPGPHPGVIVIHELYGLNDNIRAICQRFAGEGYVGLAIDLFSNANRALCLARIMGGILVKPLRNGTVSELQAAIQTLQTGPTWIPSASA